MNKKHILILAIIIIIISIILIFNYKKKEINKKNDNVTNNLVEEINYDFNSSTMQYEIYNSKGEVVDYTQEEEQAKYLMEFYQRNPDYHSEPPSIPNLEISDKIY